MLYLITDVTGHLRGVITRQLTNSGKEVRLFYPNIKFRL
jgi:uncharacterized protein YbjT (DUF2867 family)